MSSGCPLFTVHKNVLVVLMVRGRKEGGRGRKILAYCFVVNVPITKQQMSKEVKASDLPVLLKEWVGKIRELCKVLNCQFAFIIFISEVCFKRLSADISMFFFPTYDTSCLR